MVPIIYFSTHRRNVYELLRSAYELLRSATKSTKHVAMMYTLVNNNAVCDDNDWYLVFFNYIAT